MAKIHKLGNGVFGWGRGERVSDRYGCVKLFDEHQNEKRLNQKHEGEPAKLYAIVRETRQSGHIGDWFRGLFPETPDVGERIDFGKGEVFYEDGGVGLMPADERESDWLNPKMLYRAHDQTVDLFLELS